MEALSPTRWPGSWWPGIDHAEVRISGGGGKVAHA